MLDHCSLSHRSSSSVYSTTVSCGSISDSWYLYRSASRWCGQQKSSTVEPEDLHLRRSSESWLAAQFNTHWSMNSFQFVVQLPTVLQSSRQTFDWYSSSRGRSVEAELLVPFWYQLTQVVLEKRRLNGCSKAHSNKTRRFDRTTDLERVPPGGGVARLSWPSWLVTHRDGIPARRRSPIQVITRLDVD